MAVPAATVAKQRQKALIGGTTGALSQDETVAKILEGMEMGVARDTVIKGLLFGQDFCIFSFSKGEPSGSSCVAPARSCGRGYFFFSQVRRVVVRVVETIIFPQRVAEHEQFTHNGNHAACRWAGVPVSGHKRRFVVGYSVSC